MEQLWYVVGFAFAGVSFVFLTIGAAWLVSHRNRGDVHKGLPYESGIDTYGDTHGRFGLSFYIYALLFVAFDIEVVFIYLWAIAFRDLLARRARQHADLRRDPAPRPRLRLAEGGPDMALTEDPRASAPDPADATAIGSDVDGPARRCLRRGRRTPWPRRSSCRTPSGRRPIPRPTTAGGRPTSPTSPSSRRAAPGRRDDARWGGVLEVIPTKADYVLDLIRMNSLWPLLSGLACCAIEMMSAATSKNDMDRWGMFPFRASPRQADVLIVAGTLTTKMAGPLVRLWEQMPEPKWCVAMGDCTCSGGRYKRSYSTVEGIDRVMPVDVYVPGLPAPPGGPHLRDDEAPAARQGPPRPLARPGDRPDRPGAGLTVDRALKARLEAPLRRPADRARSASATTRPRSASAPATSSRS